MFLICARTKSRDGKTIKTEFETTGFTDREAAALNLNSRSELTWDDRQDSWWRRQGDQLVELTIEVAAAPK